MIATPEEQAYYLSELNHTPSPHTRILTPDEQADCREEIDYLIDMHGPEYIWGKETAMDKTKSLLRDVPGRIAGGIERIASNPTIIAMNERARKMNTRLCKEEEERSCHMQEQMGRRAYARESRRKPPFGGGGLGGGVGLDFGGDRL